MKQRSKTCHTWLQSVMSMIIIHVCGHYVLAAVYQRNKQSQQNIANNAHEEL
jgi:hypothetical protein